MLTFMAFESIIIKKACTKDLTPEKIAFPVVIEECGMGALKNLVIWPWSLSHIKDIP